jgi:SPP1 family predicted phage head-tail adaptor
MQMINAGDLNTRIQILKAANKKDAAGNIIPLPYSLRCIVWAKVKAQTSHVALANGEESHEITTIIIIRHNPNVIYSDRIMIGKRKFEQIGPPINIDEKNTWTQLTCKEVVPYE